MMNGVNLCTLNNTSGPFLESIDVFIGNPRTADVTIVSNIEVCTVHEAYDITFDSIQIEHINGNYLDSTADGMFIFLIQDGRKVGVNP